MSVSRRKSLAVRIALCACLSPAAIGYSQSHVYVDPAKNWVGYMNWFENNSGSQGNYAGGSSWGTDALQASFSGITLSLAPNTNVYNPSDSYWVNGDGSGAKWMDANFYVENAGLAGQTLTFSGDVLANTLVSPYTSVAFIKEFTPTYSLVQSQTAPLTGGSPFDLQLTSTAGNIIQYGFETMGPDANPDTVASLGSVSIAAVPEPSTLALLSLGFFWVPIYLRQRKS